MALIIAIGALAKVWTLERNSWFQVRVRLVVPQQALQFGEQIKCVGEDANLGNWYDKAAPFLSWTEGKTCSQSLLSGHKKLKTGCVSLAFQTSTSCLNKNICL